jgi:calcium/calmodulin-dependent protein kinase I
LLPEIRSFCVKARLRRGIDMIKLANRIEALKQQEDFSEDTPGDADVPAQALEAAGEKLAAGDFSTGLKPAETKTDAHTKPSLSRLARGAIFKEVVLAKVREEKEAQKQRELEEKAAALSMSPKGGPSS